MKVIISMDRECVLTCERLKRLYINNLCEAYQIVAVLDDDEIIIAEYSSNEKAITALRFVATFLSDDCSNKNLLKMPDEEYAQELLEILKKQNS